MTETLITFVLLFFIYSFVGWVIEVIYTGILTKVWINRGFLVGPLCPIYGCGAILLTLILNKYSNDYFVLFAGALIICSVLEYSTGYLLERIFKARWWDYSEFKFNINGLVCLETMIPFGIGGTLIVGVINPLLYKGLGFIPLNIKLIIGFIIWLVFIIDLIFSFKVVSTIKGSISNIRKDNTEEIKKKIESITQAYFYLRIFKAFPDLAKKLVNIKVLDKARETLKKVQRKKHKN